MILASVGRAGVAMEEKMRSKGAPLNREARANGPRTSELSTAASVVLAAMTLASVGEAGVAMEGKPRSKQVHLNREARASGPRTSEMSRVAPVVLVAVTGSKPAMSFSTTLSHMWFRKQANFAVGMCKMKRSSSKAALT